MLKWLIVVSLVVGAVWWLAPREPVVLGPVAADLPADLPADLDEWVAGREAGIAPDLARRIDWAGEPGAQTPLALVYLHGFSAAPPEIRPVAEEVAQALGANLYVARLTGHGQGGAALAQARVADWWRDTAEAIAVGHRLGQKVVVIGTSTGATLLAEAARDPVLGPQIDAAVMISPNFKVKNPAAMLLTMPFARQWVPLVAGRERCFEPANPEHAKGWTTCYPTTALLPMAALVDHARRGDYGPATQPLLAIWDDADSVVDAATTRKILAGWGGPVTQSPVQTGAGDDPNHHVIAGDILSPGMTAQVVQIISDWLRRMPD